MLFFSNDSHIRNKIGIAASFIFKNAASSVRYIVKDYMKTKLFAGLRCRDIHICYSVSSNHDSTVILLTDLSPFDTGDRVFVDGM